MKAKYLLYVIAILILLLKITPAYSLGDTTYVYSYDASGNRTDRIIDLTKSGKIPNGSSISSEDFFDDKIADFNIKIYPNPTKGILKVEIPGLGDQNARLAIYNLQGKQIVNNKVFNNLSTVNLSNYPPGMYILKILIGQKSSEWKIIKD